MIQVKVKFSYHMHEIIWRNGYVVSPISSHVVFAPLPIYHRGKSSRYPLSGRLVVPRDDLDALEKN